MTMTIKSLLFAAFVAASTILWHAKAEHHALRSRIGRAKDDRPSVRKILEMAKPPRRSLEVSDCGLFITFVRYTSHQLFVVYFNVREATSLHLAVKEARAIVVAAAAAVKDLGESSATTETTTTILVLQRRPVKKLSRRLMLPRQIPQSMVCQE